MGRPSIVNGIYGAHLFGVKGINVTRNPTDEFQTRVEIMLINKLIELCVNRFKWQNLPSTVSPRFLELALFYQGLAVWIKHPSYGFLALRGTGTRPDFYNDPTRFRVYGNGYVSGTYSDDECVPIWANYTRTPELETVLLYANRLATMDVTININTKNARQPRVVSSTENSRLSFENFNNQIDAGVPTIKVDTSLDPMASVGVLDMGVDADLFDKLGIARTRVWNECMSLLGIKNSNQDKKERLVADEVDANDEQVGYMRAVNLNARQQAAAKINDMFPNQNISVDYDDDIFTGALALDNTGGDA